MNKPHKHAELIKAWANGAEIESRYDSDSKWTTCDPPYWYVDKEYRIKPQPVVQKMYMHYDNIEKYLRENRLFSNSIPQVPYDHNLSMSKHLEFTFTDGKLTNVEMKDATY